MLTAALVLIVQVSRKSYGLPFCTGLTRRHEADLAERNKSSFSAQPELFHFLPIWTHAAQPELATYKHPASSGINRQQGTRPAAHSGWLRPRGHFLGSVGNRALCSSWPGLRAWVPRHQEAVGAQGARARGRP